MIISTMQNYNVTWRRYEYDSNKIIVNNVHIIMNVINNNSNVSYVINDIGFFL